MKTITSSINHYFYGEDEGSPLFYFALLFGIAMALIILLKVFWKSCKIMYIMVEMYIQCIVQCKQQEKVVIASNI